MPQSEPAQAPAGLYDRQQRIKEVSPVKSAIVIGVGGVGSWVALFLAMSGTKKLFLIDPDLIEESNLARIPLSPADVGSPKVVALATFITQLRTDCSVEPMQALCEDIPSFIQETPEWKDAEVFDCRDNTDTLPATYNPCKITGGYDGLRATLFKNPNNDDLFGENHTYTITPSYVIPPVILGALIALYATVPTMQTEGDRTATFDMRQLFDNLFTEAKASCQ